MEDLVFDRLGKRYLPHFYFSARADGLGFAIVATLGWIYFGWDGTFEQLTGGKYGVGIHWSTLQTFALFFYLLVLNLQVGGVRSWRQLGREVWRDLRTNGRELEILWSFMKGGEARMEAKASFRELRESYRRYAAVDALRAACFGALFAFAATFIFEDAWVPLYDYFQFGSVFWPVYSLAGDSPLGLWLNPLSRNVLYSTVPLALGAVMLYAAVDGEGSAIVRRFRISWRTDRWWAIILAMTVASWLAWVYFPHTAFNPSQLTPAGVISIHPMNATYFYSHAWTFPKGGLFPQTEYTFYPAAVYLEPYQLTQIFGFYVDNGGIHLVNVVTKYLMFAAVCYPAFLRVEKSGEGR